MFGLEEISNAFPQLLPFLVFFCLGPHLVDCSGVTLGGGQGTLWCLELSPELPHARPGTQPSQALSHVLEAEEHRACTVSQLRIRATRPLFQLTQPSTSLYCLHLNISSLFPNILAQGIICFQMSSSNVSISPSLICLTFARSVLPHLEGMLAFHYLKIHICFPLRHMSCFMSRVESNWCRGCTGGCWNLTPREVESRVLGH